MNGVLCGVAEQSTPCVTEWKEGPIAIWELLSMGGDEVMWAVDLRMWPMAEVPRRRETL